MNNSRKMLPSKLRRFFEGQSNTIFGSVSLKILMIVFSIVGFGSLISLFFASLIFQIPILVGFLIIPIYLVILMYLQIRIRLRKVLKDFEDKKMVVVKEEKILPQYETEKSKEEQSTNEGLITKGFSSFRKKKVDENAE